MEAAGMGIPALAVSLETDSKHYFSYSTEVDFSAAAYFAAYFGRRLLEKRFPPDVDLLKVDVPSDATAETPWMVTRLSRQMYFVPTKPVRESFDKPAKVGFRLEPILDGEPEDSDVYVLRGRKQVAVTPLSLDATSRVDFRTLDDLLRSG
jgi:5'-nucleotidase